MCPQRVDIRTDANSNVICTGVEERMGHLFRIFLFTLRFRERVFSEGVAAVCSGLGARRQLQRSTLVFSVHW